MHLLAFRGHVLESVIKARLWCMAGELNA
jgi:hypothetical protein